MILNDKFTAHVQYEMLINFFDALSHGEPACLVTDDSRSIFLSDIADKALQPDHLLLHQSSRTTIKTAMNVALVVEQGSQMPYCHKVVPEMYESILVSVRCSTQTFCLRNPC